MPQTANRIHSPSHSPPSDDENTPPLSLDASKEALIKVSMVTIFVNTESCDCILEIARRNQAAKNSLTQENEALYCKLADISNVNDDKNNENPGTGTTHQSKRRKTHNPTPTGSDDEAQDDTDTGQLKDEFISNMGHKFCVIYAPRVYKGADIFKIKFNNMYDAAERFEDDNNRFQDQLHEIVGLLKEQLTVTDLSWHGWKTMFNSG